MTINIPSKVKGIMQKLIDNNFDAYIIGGAVRDYLLSVKPHDYDIFTNATGKQILKLFSKGKVIGGDERQAKILTVIVDNVEVSQYRANGDRTETGNNLDAHLATCDYNVNAMACDIEGNIIDKYRGKESLQNNYFEFVGKPEDRIKEDPLRLLRGIRLVCQFGLQVKIDTKEALQKRGILLKGLPQERVKDEIMRLCRYEDSFTQLRSVGYLKYILPELQALVGLDAGPHHNEKDCFEHVNLAYKNSCQLTNNVLLRFAVLLHDIGKGPSAKIIDGEITFHNHQIDSERMVHKLMKRLKFSKKQRNYCAVIAKQHMMGPVNKMRDITFARICDELDKAEVAPEDMIIQMYSDNQANLTKQRLTFHSFIKENPFLRKYYEFKYSRKPFNKNDIELSGKDLIALGVEKGPQIGVILKDIYEAIHEGKVINRKDRLLEYVKGGQMR